MKLDEIQSAIESIAPPGLAQEWDNVGLLLGRRDGEVKNILLTIDVTEAVAAEAEKTNTDLILSYHPVIWDGLKRIAPGEASGVVYRLIRKGIAVYSMHTALDVAVGGVNDGLAEIVGIEDGRPIGDYVDDPGGGNYKLVVFVPAESAEQVAEAVFDAGAGAIGNYSRCGFRTSGVGSFLPLEGAHPARGKKSRLETAEEIRFEAIVPAGLVTAVVSAMRQTHPYETPAFDVLKLYDFESRFGLGRMGSLAEPATVSEIIARLKRHTGVKAVGVVGPEKRRVRTAAVCAGSCGKIINSVIAAECELYVTGELKHHYALAASEAGVTCLCLSHTVSERFILKKLARLLRERLKEVTIRISKKDEDPFSWKVL